MHTYTHRHTHTVRYVRVCTLMLIAAYAPKMHVPGNALCVCTRAAVCVHMVVAMVVCLFVCTRIDVWLGGGSARCVVCACVHACRIMRLLGVMRCMQASCPPACLRAWVMVHADLECFSDGPCKALCALVVVHAKPYVLWSWSMQSLMCFGRALC